jgi:hypothetical protein
LKIRQKNYKKRTGKKMTNLNQLSYYESNSVEEDKEAPEQSTEDVQSQETQETQESLESQESRESSLLNFLVRDIGYGSF